MFIKNGISFNDDGIAVYKNDELICSFPNTRMTVNRFPSAKESKQKAMDCIFTEESSNVDSEILAIRLSIEKASINQKFAILCENDISENNRKLLMSLGYKLLEVDTYEKNRHRWVIYWN